MGLQVGRVLKRVKSFYYVEIDHQEVLCRIKGSLFKESAYDQRIAVGDEVEVEMISDQDAMWIHRILPRHNKLARPIRSGNIEQVLAANIDYLLIVVSAKHPPFRPGLIDRFLVAAAQGGIDPVILLNKIDLLDSPKEAATHLSLYQQLGYPTLATSVAQSIGLEDLRNQLHQKTTALVGHSGVGKSSLLKALFPDWEIKVGEVSQGTKKGQHTTTLAQMYPLPDGGYIIDSPGIRELGIHSMTPHELSYHFIEFEGLIPLCRFKGCSHRHEPQCAIRDAIEEGTIATSRYQSYLSILES